MPTTGWFSDVPATEPQVPSRRTRRRRRRRCRGRRPPASSRRGQAWLRSRRSARSKGPRPLSRRTGPKANTRPSASATQYPPPSALAMPAVKTFVKGMPLFVAVPKGLMRSAMGEVLADPCTCSDVLIPNFASRGRNSNPRTTVPTDREMRDRLAVNNRAIAAATAPSHSPQVEDGLTKTFFARVSSAGIWQNCGCIVNWFIVMPAHHARPDLLPRTRKGRL